MAHVHVHCCSPPRCARRQTGRKSTKQKVEPRDEEIFLTTAGTCTRDNADLSQSANSYVFGSCALGQAKDHFFRA